MNIPVIGRLTFWKVFAIALFCLGIFVVGVRYFIGLGASTNLTDTTPWGLWIGFDLLVGVGLAAGGFVIAATVHIFGITKYKPIARPAILTAFLGYLLVIVALLFDLGQPWRIWHAIVMWNHHSVMFEVAWCVMLYTTVLALEFSPMLFERLGWNIPLKIIRAIYIPLVIAGVLLSTMHQSSLGSLYVIAPDKLHGLWYSSMLPVFFFTSAIAGGLAMTIFESYMSCRAFGKRLEPDLLRGMARVIVVILAAYAVMRVWDLILMDNLHLAFQFTLESALFWGEVGLGVFLPMVLFAIRRIRHSQHGLFFAALLTLTGFVMNRLNVSLTGMQAASETGYFPHWMEWTVTACIVAAGFVFFSLAVKHLNVFGGECEIGHEEAPLRRARPILSGRIVAGLWILVLIGVVVVGIGMSQSETAAKPDAEIASAVQQVEYTPDSDITLPEDFAFPMGEDSPGEVIFSHDSHVDYDAVNCAACHRNTFRLLKGGSLLNGELTYDEIHSGEACFSCHDGEAAFSVEEDCSYCHME